MSQLNVPMRAPQAQPAEAADPGDQVTINNEPTPEPPPSPQDSKFGSIVKSALLGGAVLAFPTVFGAATGPWGAVALGVATVALPWERGPLSGAALALGGGGLALALAGNAFGAPAVGIAAAAGAIAMGGLMAQKGFGEQQNRKLI